MKPAVLTIAGSDPSGGAGIQQDLKVFAALGVVGLSAITAVTVQNSQGVRSVHPIPADVLYSQIEAILEDSDVAAVKIGMLAGADQVRSVADLVRRHYKLRNVVLDPVLASTGGFPLLDGAGRAALVEQLFPICDLVTPNALEAAELSGLPVFDLDSMAKAARHIHALGPYAVLVKGGHIDGPCGDILVNREGLSHVVDSRVDTADCHGTGCIHSSAIAAYLARGLELKSAIVSAKALVTRALDAPVRSGQGCGYPDVFRAANLLERDRDRTHAGKIRVLHGLYVIADSSIQLEFSLADIAAAAAFGGANVVQMREKGLPTPELVALAKELSEVDRGMLFVGNDRVDVALASGADGVHLGPDDMHPADARRILGPEKLIGISASTVEEAVPLAQYASYIGVGAIFGSKTKDDAGPPVGVERIREFKAAFPNHPIVAVGGITKENIGEVAKAGADAAAVISAVVGAPDMTEAVRELVKRFEAGKR